MKKENDILVPHDCPVCGGEFRKILICRLAQRDYYNWRHPDNECALVKHYPTQLFILEHHEIPTWNQQIEKTWRLNHENHT